jgi:AmiR/NasT family two-component response regulator
MLIYFHYMAIKRFGLNLVLFLVLSSRVDLNETFACSNTTVGSCIVLLVSFESFI